MSYRRGGLDRDVHMLRDLGDRVRRTELHRAGKKRRPGVQVGGWHLMADPDTGDLVAMHRKSGTRQVIATVESEGG